MIAQGDLVAFSLCSTALETHLRGSINIKFVRSVGENDRTNVPPFYDQIVATGIVMKFFSDNFANCRQPANPGYAFVHTTIAQMFCGIDITDDDARLGSQKTVCNRRWLES